MVHWDGAGNVTPQRSLGRELARRGHEVHALTHDAVAAQMGADGVTIHRLPTARQFRVADAYPSAEAQMAFIVAEVVGSARFAADFKALWAELRPDLCLVDSALIAVMDAALAIGARPIVLWHWIYAPRVFGGFNRVTPTMPGPVASMSYPELIESAPLVLPFCYPDFSPEPSIPANVRHVGPAREVVAAPAWPRRHPDRPMVLVALSTGNQDQLPTLRRICDALGDLPVEALVTTGPIVAPEALTAAGNIDVRAFVDHDAVLPACDLVVTHAGLGTVLKAAGAGVPMLCLPMGHDQSLNAERVEALGLGRAISAEAAADELAGAMIALLADQATYVRCKAFAAGVSRFGDLALAADLVEHQAALV